MSNPVCVLPDRLSHEEQQAITAATVAQMNAHLDDQVIAAWSQINRFAPLPTFYRDETPDSEYHKLLSMVDKLMDVCEGDVFYPEILRAEFIVYLVKKGIFDLSTPYSRN